MKKIIVLFGLLLGAGISYAATPVAGQATISWTLPTTDVNGQPLTGAEALKSVQLILGTSPIADTDSSVTVTLNADGTTVPVNYVYNGAVAGTTLYVRGRVCNNVCSLLGPQGSGIVKYPYGAPAPMTGITITFAQ